MNHSKKSGDVAQNQSETAENIHAQLLSLIEIAENNQLSFIAYLLQMAAHEAREIAEKDPDLESGGNRQK